jgi:hypothetical protein
MSDEELARVLDRSAELKDDPNGKAAYRVVEQVGGSNKLI